MILMADMPVNTEDQKTKKKKEEMENDNKVMCHLEKEGMSWKTMTPWQAKWQKQKENTEELFLPPLHNIHGNECNHAKDSK